MPVAVITGASRGLGRALSTELAGRGWSLVLDARDEHALAAAVAALPGGPHRAVPGDVTDPDHRRALVAAADELGGADLLVNNASTLGASPLPSFADLDPATYAEVFAVNVVAPMALVRDLLPGLRARGGRVLDISSDAAVEPYETWGAYGSSKAALDHATRILAAEEPSLARVRRGPRRHAHPDAPGRVPGRGHLRPGRARDGRPGPAAAGVRRPAERALPRVRADGGPGMSSPQVARFRMPSASEATRPARGPRAGP